MSSSVAVGNIHKHFCLQMWWHACFKHTPAITIYVLLARDSSCVFSLCLHKLPHPANHASNLDWDVRGQRSENSREFDQRHFLWGQENGQENKRGSDNSSIHISQLSLTLISHLKTEANLWAVEATPNLDIMTYGAFLHHKSILYKHT